MKVLLLKGGLQLSARFKKVFFRQFIPPKPADLQGYSIKKIMVFGLILPFFVFLGLFSSIYVSLTFKLPLNIACLIAFLWTFSGFAFGTFILTRFSNKILKYAEVKRK